MVAAISILIVTASGVPDVPAADEYVFVEDTNRTVSFTRGEHIFMGELDSQGEFHERNRYDRNTPLTSPGDILYFPRPKSFPVYEYRSGRLIKGVIDTDGYFVPDLDSKIIAFKDYKYTPEAPRIWNLPGRFEKKGADKK